MSDKDKQRERDRLMKGSRRDVVHDEVMNVFVDARPVHARIGSLSKAEFEHSLRAEVTASIDKSYERLKQIGVILIETGPHLQYIDEARELFIRGFDRSCVAMCGLSAERILKDTFARSLRVVVNGSLSALGSKAVDACDRFDVSRIRDFLLDAGVIDSGLSNHYKRLAELRNKHMHAPSSTIDEKDVVDSMRLLLAIIDATVSIDFGESPERAKPSRKSSASKGTNDDRVGDPTSSAQPPPESPTPPSPSS